MRESIQTMSAFICVDFSVCGSSYRQQVAFDEGTDEFSAYFNGLTNPKVLITTSDRPRGVSCSVFCFTTLIALSKLANL